MESITLTISCSTISPITATRERLDALILDFSSTWSDALLDQPIRYRDMAGEKHERPLR